MALGGFGGSSVGCSHDPPPVVQPGDPPPPLPPASGTPIGYLVDASELKLSDDQLAKLKVIDDDLAKKLAYLDGVQRSAVTASEPAGKQDTSRGGLGFQASGQRTGSPGDNTTLPAHLNSDPSASGGGGSQSSASERAEVLRRVPEARAFDVRMAIAHALAVLDSGQQKIARQVLKDRGIDPDTGRFEATGEPGPGRGSDSGSGSGSGSK